VSPRAGGRKPLQIRTPKITRNQNIHAEGSALICMGNTKVLCNASVEERVPPFLRGSGSGWVTAEYAMLPRATQTRSMREAISGRPSGRTQEISRLIGRCLRAVTLLEVLGERTVIVDCDVLQADGGTRTAAITGGFVALVDAFRDMASKGIIDRLPVTDYVAAVSVGIVGGRVLVDLDYSEDSEAEVDMNFVATGAKRFVEIQGCAERTPFTAEQMEKMTQAALKGLRRLVAEQRRALDRPRFREIGA